MAQAHEAHDQTSGFDAAPAAAPDVPTHRWALKYGDRVYGPYSFDAMKAYVAEGRVAEHSLLAPEGTPAGAGMWQYAIDIPLFAALLRDHVPTEAAFAGESSAETAVQTTPEAGDAGEVREDEAAETMDRYEAEPAAAADEPGQQTETTPQTASDGRRPAYGPGKGQIDRRRQPDTANFIIVMDIKARFAGPLEQAIMSLGPAYKLSANVWCVNTDATAAGLLNDLSQYIGRSDSMFIADTTRDRTAWSSMGPEVDAKIRRVWRRAY
ncbi:MAG: hypothetical protein RH982_12020 [Parvibaculum sp.]